MRNYALIFVFFLSFITVSCSKDSSSNSIPGSYVGNWAGTYSGDDFGSWTATIDSKGVLTGETDEGFVKGSVDASGKWTAGIESTGVSFTGQIDGNTISGTWKNIEDPTFNGTFKGNKVQ
jgi:hypothetical protein